MDADAVRAELVERARDVWGGEPRVDAIVVDGPFGDWRQRLIARVVTTGRDGKPYGLTVESFDLDAEATLFSLLLSSPALAREK